MDIRPHTHTFIAGPVGTTEGSELGSLHAEIKAIIARENTFLMTGCRCRARGRSQSGICASLRLEAKNNNDRSWKRSWPRRGPIVGQYEATKAQTAKDCSEQFYTDLRRSMSAWLLQRRFDTHDKTSLGAPNRRFAVPQADGHLSTGVGHNEHLLHHRRGGRDHSRRRFFGPASIRKSCKPWSRRSLQDASKQYEGQITGKWPQGFSRLGGAVDVGHAGGVEHGCCGQMIKKSQDIHMSALRN